MLVEIKVVL